MRLAHVNLNGKHGAMVIAPSPSLSVSLRCDSKEVYKDNRVVTDSFSIQECNPISTKDLYEFYSINQSKNNTNHHDIHQNQNGLAFNEYNQMSCDAADDEEEDDDDNNNKRLRFISKSNDEGMSKVEDD